VGQLVESALEHPRIEFTPSATDHSWPATRAVVPDVVRRVSLTHCRAVQVGEVDVEAVHVGPPALDSPGRLAGTINAGQRPAADLAASSLRHPRHSRGAARAGPAPPCKCVPNFPSSPCTDSPPSDRWLAGRSWRPLGVAGAHCGSVDFSVNPELSLCGSVLQPSRTLTKPCPNDLSPAERQYGVGNLEHPSFRIAAPIPSAGGGGRGRGERRDSFQ
jgi:hypothetical protein